MSIGNILRSAREEKRQSIPEVSERIRISKKYIQALEEENFLLIPSLVYAKGFLKAYAEFLGLDVKPLLAELLEKFKVKEEPKRREVKEEKPKGPQIRLDFDPKYLIYGGVIILLALIMLYGLSIPRENTAGNPEAVPTPEAVRAEKPKAAALVPPTKTVQQDKRPGVKLIGAARSDVKVISDGVQVYNGPLDRGNWAIYRGKEVKVKAENGGAVRVILNGKDMGMLGGNGQPAELIFYPYK